MLYARLFTLLYALFLYILFYAVLYASVVQTGVCTVFTVLYALVFLQSYACCMTTLPMLIGIKCVMFFYSSVVITVKIRLFPKIKHCLFLIYNKVRHAVFF